MSKWCGLLLVVFCYTAQSQSIDSFMGLWSGELTQKEGGYLDRYSFELYLVQSNGNIEGRTYVTAQGVEGVMAVKGQLRGNTIYLEEKELLHSRKPSDLSWCFKTMQLRLVSKAGVWFLEGPWQGSSSYGACLPGWISMRKSIPRA